MRLPENGFLKDIEAVVIHHNIRIIDHLGHNFIQDCFILLNVISTKNVQVEIFFGNFVK